MNIGLSTNQLKLQALQKVVYHPLYDENEKALELIELDTFDLDTIIDKVKERSRLLSHKDEIVEILEILNMHKSNFFIDVQKYFSFYWNGMLLLRIIINNEFLDTKKQVHISLQKYRDELNERMSDRRMNRFTLFGIGGTLLLGSIIAGITFLKRKD